MVLDGALSQTRRLLLGLEMATGLELAAKLCPRAKEGSTAKENNALDGMWDLLGILGIGTWNVSVWLHGLDPTGLCCTETYTLAVSTPRGFGCRFVDFLLTYYLFSSISVVVSGWVSDDHNV